MKYWFGSRSADAFLKEKFDIFELFEREQLQVRQSVSRYSLRKKTVKMSEEVWREKNSIFPKSACEWFEKFGEVRKEGIRIFAKMLASYKIGLKKRYVSCLIHKKTKIEAAVKQINEKYKLEILG